MSNVKYRSGDWTIAKAVGILRNEQPLMPELNDVLVFHQDYVQLLANWAALDYNTINPDLAGPAAYLFNESERQDFGGNVVKWTRSWVRIPNSYGKSGGTYPYPFPGFDGANDTTYARPVITMPVAMEILREFFLCGNFGEFPTWQDIPIIKAFRPYNIAADPTDKTDLSVDDGGRGFIVRDANLALPKPDLGTSPSLTEYKAMIAAGAVIDVEDSKVCNFRGGVYMRERYTVKAQ